MKVYKLFEMIVPKVILMTYQENLLTIARKISPILYMVGGNDWESEEDEEEYYENTIDECGWDYVTQEEWEDAGSSTE